MGWAPFWTKYSETHQVTLLRTPAFQPVFRPKTDLPANLISFDREKKCSHLKVVITLSHLTFFSFLSVHHYVDVHRGQ
jgi:hypothetical protein